MMKYNEELTKAGVLLAGEGLQPSSKGTRVKFFAGKPTVIDDPFPELRELIAGFWMFQVKPLRIFSVHELDLPMCGHNGASTQSDRRRSAKGGDHFTQRRSDPDLGARRRAFLLCASEPSSR